MNTGVPNVHAHGEGTAEPNANATVIDGFRGEPGAWRRARRVRGCGPGKRAGPKDQYRAPARLHHDRIGRAGVSGPEDLKAKALAALHRLQRLPHLVKSFFRDPNLRYITA